MYISGYVYTKIFLEEFKRTSVSSEERTHLYPVFCGARYGTQGLVHVKHVLYHGATPTAQDHLLFKTYCHCSLSVNTD